MPELTAGDWEEIYYAVEDKLRFNACLRGNDEATKAWRAHLKQILKKLGPDGQNMTEGGRQ